MRFSVLVFRGFLALGAGALFAAAGPSFAQSAQVPPQPTTPAAKPTVAPSPASPAPTGTATVTATPDVPSDKPGALPGEATTPTTVPTPDLNRGAPAAGPSAAPSAAPSTWRYIVIHHSASPGGNAAVFDRLHRAKGWDGVAYHFVITNGHGGPDGGLQISPRWWAQKHGAHAGALPEVTSADDRNCYNEFGIGICLVGNFEHHHPTQRQLVTLSHLIEHLRQKYQIPPENIMGHRHVKSTACPGGDFPWAQVFSLAGMPAPQHLYRHYATATHERCPWCIQRGYVPATRVASRKIAPATAAATPDVKPEVKPDVKPEIKPEIRAEITGSPAPASAPHVPADMTTH